MEHRRKTKTDLLEEFHANQQTNKRHEEGTRNKIKETAKEVFEFSLFPGLSNIVRSSWPVKLTWMFSHLCLLSIAVYLVVNNITTYLKYDVITQVRQINQFPIDFPTVTVCNLNPCATEYCLKRQIPYQLNFGNASTIESNKYYLQQFGYTLGQVAFFSYFNLWSFPKNFKWYYHQQFGNCYQFNSGRDDNNQPVPIQPTTKPGAYGGLEIIGFAGISVEVEEKFNVGNFGMAIFVHTNTTSPYSLQPIVVNVNTATNIVVSNVKTKREPQPYSSCQKIEGYKSHLVDLILEQGYDYHQADCYIQCYQWYLVTNCSCIDKYHFSYFFSLPCNFSGFCFNKVASNFANPEFFESACSSLCPLECETSRYDTSLSNSYFPTPIQALNFLTSYPYIADLLYSNNYSFPELGMNIFRINVYFDTLAYTEITETPAIDVITLFSSIGGSIALMLGVSIATLVEFVELAVQIIIVFKNSRSKSYKVGNTSKAENAREQSVKNKSKEMMSGINQMNQLDLIDFIMNKLDAKLDERFGETLIRR